MVNISAPSLLRMLSSLSHKMVNNHPSLFIELRQLFPLLFCMTISESVLASWPHPQYIYPRLGYFSSSSITDTQPPTQTGHYPYPANGPQRLPAPFCKHSCQLEIRPRQLTMLIDRNVSSPSAPSNTVFSPYKRSPRRSDQPRQRSSYRSPHPILHPAQNDNPPPTLHSGAH